VAKRKRTYNVRLIKATWAYSVQEIATLFGLHKNAVLRWLKEGLRSIDNRRPYLTRGDELARFLSARQSGRKRKCGTREFYCFKCHALREAYLGIADIIFTSPTRFRVKAICAVCSTSVNKVQGTRNLQKIQDSFHVQQLTGEHLTSITEYARNGFSMPDHVPRTHESQYVYAKDTATSRGLRRLSGQCGWDSMSSEPLELKRCMLPTT